MTDCVVDDLARLGIRKARKQSKDDLRAAIPVAVANIIGTAGTEFGPDSPEVIECGPQGRTIFSTCQDDEISGPLQTLIAGVTAHQATLVVPLVTKATNLPCSPLSSSSARFLISLAALPRFPLQTKAARRFKRVRDLGNKRTHARDPCLGHTRASAGTGVSLFLGRYQRHLPVPL
mgnify:CR=1 FL=1